MRMVGKEIDECNGRVGREDIQSRCVGIWVMRWSSTCTLDRCLDAGFSFSRGRDMELICI